MRWFVLYFIFLLEKKVLLLLEEIGVGNDYSVKEYNTSKTRKGKGVAKRSLIFVELHPYDLNVLIVSWKGGNRRNTYTLADENGSFR